MPSKHEELDINMVNFILSVDIKDAEIEREEIIKRLLKLYEEDCEVDSKNF